MASRPGPGQGLRLPRLDALRGAALLWMALFHACFDWNLLGLQRRWAGHDWDFYRDPFWTLQRVAIVSLFLLCAGVGQAVATQQAQPWPRFWRRWAQVAGGALLVSLGSLLVFPRSWISFGVLHGMAVMVLLTRLLAGRMPPRPGVWLLLAALALAAPLCWQHSWFDSRWTNWLGLVTRKPVTEDYVPVLPWLGVMLGGLALGQWCLARRGAAPLGGYLPSTLAPLAWLGRRPLLFYLLHQPLLLALLWGLSRLLPGRSPA